MTKQEALAKIDELKNYIEELEKSHHIKDFEIGDVFRANETYSVVLPCYGYCNDYYTLGELDNMPLCIYSNGSGKLTKREVLDILNRHSYEKVGNINKNLKELCG